MGFQNCRDYEAILQEFCSQAILQNSSGLFFPSYSLDAKGIYLDKSCTSWQDTHSSTGDLWSVRWAVRCSSAVCRELPGSRQELGVRKRPRGTQLGYPSRCLQPAAPPSPPLCLGDWTGWSLGAQAALTSGGVLEKQQEEVGRGGATLRRLCPWGEIPHGAPGHLVGSCSSKDSLGNADLGDI